MHSGNVWYGHRFILNTYAGLKNRKIQALIPHGVYDRRALTIRSEHRYTNLDVFCYPEYTEGMYINSGWDADQLIPSCSPFVYAIDLYGVRPRPDSGSLYFAAHSIGSFDMGVNAAQIAESIKYLPKPVTVCLHPNDVTLRLGQELRDIGVEYTTCGRREGIHFTANVISMINNNRYVYAESPGTSSLYAIAMGRPFMTIGEKPSNYIDFEFHRELYRTSGEFHEDVPSEQVDIAYYYLRVKDKMDKADLRTLITELNAKKPRRRRDRLDWP